MTTSDLESELDVQAKAARVTNSELIVDFEDGRTLSVPLSWYPRLLHGTSRERQNFRIGGFGIHWPDLDEDISFRGLLLGRASGESSASLEFWLSNHRRGKKVTAEDFMKYRRQRRPNRAKKLRKSA